jgi:hypothetical protein
MQIIAIIAVLFIFSALIHGLTTGEIDITSLADNKIKSINYYNF